MYYGPFILRDAGFGEEGNKALLINTVPLSVCSFIGGLLAICLSEKVGRRSSMLMSLPLIGSAMLALSFSMLCLYKLDLPTLGSYCSLISLFVFLFCFQMGMSGTVWTLCSEIYPTHVRGVSNSLTTFSNFFFNYIVAAVFLSATSTETGKIVSYIVIAFFCALAFCFIKTYIPETKGKPLEECVNLFMTDDQIEMARLKKRDTAQEDYYLNRVSALA